MNIHRLILVSISVLSDQDSSSTFMVDYLLTMFFFSLLNGHLEFRKEQYDEFEAESDVDKGNDVVRASRSSVKCQMSALKMLLNYADDREDVSVQSVDSWKRILFSLYVRILHL